MRRLSVALTEIEASKMLSELAGPKFFCVEHGFSLDRHREEALFMAWLRTPGNTTINPDSYAAVIRVVTRRKR